MKWTTPLLALAAVAATLFGGDALELHRGALSPAGSMVEVWRVVTCHFTHFTHEQLAWDTLAFLALGIACERRNRAAFHATLLASAIVVPLAVLAFAPHVTAYRGLSGIDSALFALLLIEQRRSRLVMLCALGFLAKLAFELFAGSTVFAPLGTGVVPVPIAHLAGALTAVAISFRRHALLAAPLLLASCATLHAPYTGPRFGTCISKTLNGVWTSHHMTQLGPTLEKLVLHPDCRYYARNQLLFIRLAMTGTYSIEGDAIVIDGRRLKFRRDGRHLLVEENGELITYTRR